MKDLLNSNEPLTLERFREFFHENDFSTMPVKDPSEYTEDELELYNVVLKHINAEWKDISKKLGLNRPQDRNVRETRKIFANLREHDYYLLYIRMRQGVHSGGTRKIRIKAPIPQGHSLRVVHKKFNSSLAIAL